MSSFKKFTRIIFFLLIIIILIIVLGEFYFNPQVYFYNPVLGYLPGTIYDEGLSVDFKLVLYRIFNLFFFGGLLTGLVFYLSGKIRFKKIYLLIYIVIIPAVFIFLSPSLGFSTTFEKLKSELSHHVSTRHYEIYFDENITDDFVKLIILHHEYYFEELKKYLKTIPGVKIQSFIFFDDLQKKKLFGSGNADVAKPWLYSVFTAYDDYDVTLKHEIAHCFSADFGFSPFKIADKVNPFLIEGIASACSPFYDENNTDFLASLAYRNGYKINIERMYDFSSFFVQSSTLSYIFAGSFTKYLIDNYGIEKFKKLYTDLDFPKIYGKSIKELEAEYKTYLNDFDTGNKKDKANYYFRRKSIFYKVCPRFIADRLSKAWSHYQKKEFKEAEEIFNYTLDKSVSYSAVVGLSNTLAEMDQRDSSISVIKKYLNTFDSTVYFYNLEFNLADLYSENGNLKEADSLYQKLSLQNPNTTIYYLVNLRSVLLKNGDIIKDYLSGIDSVKYAILKNLNKQVYLYSSFPVMINLSKSVNEDYSIFKKQFDKTFFVNDFLSAYGIYRLSDYMIENLDYERARRMAGLALRFKGDKNLQFLLAENFNKINWFYLNWEKILISIKN